MKKIICCLLIFMSSCFAAEDIYQFDSQNQREQFMTLTAQLRCLVCQNQNIAESNAALANDLRDIIYQKIKAGTPNKQIIDYLVSRYGDYVLYRPPFNKATLALWCGPLLFLLVSLSYLIYCVKRRMN